MKNIVEFGSLFHVGVVPWSKECQIVATVCTVQVLPIPRPHKSSQHTCLLIYSLLIRFLVLLLFESAWCMPVVLLYTLLWYPCLVTNQIPTYKLSMGKRNLFIFLSLASSCKSCQVNWSIHIESLYGLMVNYELVSHGGMRWTCAKHVVS